MILFTIQDSELSFILPLHHPPSDIFEVHDDNDEIHSLTMENIKRMIMEGEINQLKNEIIDNKSERRFFLQFFVNYHVEVLVFFDLQFNQNHLLLLRIELQWREKEMNHPVTNYLLIDWSLISLDTERPMTALTETETISASLPRYRAWIERRMDEEDEEDWRYGG